MDFQGLAIVIAVKNGAATIGACLDSLKEPLDGGAKLYVFDAVSTDSTRQIIQERQPQATCFSENDGGLYFAWNNAIKRVQEPYLFLINCDDSLYSAANLHALLQALRGNPQLTAAGGKTQMTRADGAIRYAGAPLRRSWFVTDMPLVTVATIYTVADLQAIGGFNTQYRISSDYDLALRLIRRRGHKAFAFLDLPIIHFSLDGMSNKLRARAFREIRDILRRQYGALALVPHLAWYGWNGLKRSLLSLYMKWRAA
jgi:glycosyltransferase involved in cell wall biosynthesis